MAFLQVSFIRIFFAGWGGFLETTKSSGLPLLKKSLFGDFFIGSFNFDFWDSPWENVMYTGRDKVLHLGYKVSCKALPSWVGLFGIVRLTVCPIVYFIVQKFVFTSKVC